MKRIVTTLLALTLFWTAQAHAIAPAPPQTINYQGTLTTTGKTPVTATLSMTFALYSGDTGGSPLWSETQSVAVSKGAYSVILGSSTPIALPFDAPYYLGVTVGSDAEMTPRIALTSSPYAFNVVNGSITDLGISSSAAISDSKLAQISSAGKVSGAALTGLATVPAEAGALAVANGGTGATTASAALANLLPAQTGNGGKVLTTDGSGTSWTSVSSGVTSVSATAPLSVTSGSTTPVIALGTVGIANGGTGATSAASALNTLLPSQTGNSGKFLTTDGSTASWGTPGGGGAVSGSFFQTYIVATGNNSGNGTYYLAGSGASLTEEANHRIIPISCTSGTLRAALTVTPTSQSYTLTVRRGTAPNYTSSFSDTPFTCTLNSSSPSCSVSSSIAWSAGDSIGVRNVGNAAFNSWAGSLMVTFICSN